MSHEDYDRPGMTGEGEPVIVVDYCIEHDRKGGTCRRLAAAVGLDRFENCEIFEEVELW